MCFQLHCPQTRLHQYQAIACYHFQNHPLHLPNRLHLRLCRSADHWVRSLGNLQHHHCHRRCHRYPESSRHQSHFGNHPELSFHRSHFRLVGNYPESGLHCSHLQVFDLDHRHFRCCHHRGLGVRGHRVRQSPYLFHHLPSQRNQMSNHHSRPGLGHCRVMGLMDWSLKRLEHHHCRHRRRTDYKCCPHRYRPHR